MMNLLNIRILAKVQFRHRDTRLHRIHRSADAGLIINPHDSTDDFLEGCKKSIRMRFLKDQRGSNFDNIAESTRITCQKPLVFQRVDDLYSALPVGFVVCFIFHPLKTNEEAMSPHFRKMWVAGRHLLQMTLQVCSYLGRMVSQIFVFDHINNEIARRGLSSLESRALAGSIWRPGWLDLASIGSIWLLWAPWLARFACPGRPWAP